MMPEWHHHHHKVEEIRLVREQDSTNQKEEEERQREIYQSKIRFAASAAAEVRCDAKENKGGRRQKGGKCLMFTRCGHLEQQLLCRSLHDVVVVGEEESRERRQKKNNKNKLQIAAAAIVVLQRFDLQTLIAQQQAYFCCCCCYTTIFPPINFLSYNPNLVFKNSSTALNTPSWSQEEEQQQKKKTMTTRDQQLPRLRRIPFISPISSQLPPPIYNTATENKINIIKIPQSKKLKN